MDYTKLQRKAQKLAQKVPREPCCVCGSTHRIHRHHESYLEPTELIFLCSRHHRLLHGARRRLGIDGIEHYC